MIQNTQLPEKATNQPCMESEQVNRLLCDPDKEYTTLTKRIIRISPKYPPYRIPDSELIPILFEIPYGMVVREEDLHEWIKKKYHVKSVWIDFEISLRTWRRPDIPYWRVVSKTGCATGVLCSKEKQIQKLQDEWIELRIVNRAYKVVDLSKHLYQFGSGVFERSDF